MCQIHLRRRTTKPRPRRHTVFSTRPSLEPLLPRFAQKLFQYIRETERERKLQVRFSLGSRDKLIVSKGELAPHRYIFFLLLFLSFSRFPNSGTHSRRACPGQDGKNSLPPPPPTSMLLVVFNLFFFGNCNLHGVGFQKRFTHCPGTAAGRAAWGKKKGKSNSAYGPTLCARHGNLEHKTTSYSFLEEGFSSGTLRKWSYSAVLCARQPVLDPTKDAMA